MASVSSDDAAHAGGAHVVVVSGELDLSTVSGLRRQVDAALAAGATRLVVDLDDVTHMDSSGLAELLDALQRARLAGGGLALVVTSQPIRRTLQIRGVDGLFTVAESRRDAAAALGGS
jgi:anti-sigma B factor antagonist